ncbi:hypothetical protein Gogos_007329 [Gossypium gossypioides]|uniref:Transmembrane 9 superfamily member n=1 Tax=Gossypium gossypioides TaxID=34282 RepID=A0A7J9C8G2_GOSGO|nr:hypothetical protein [Gossypium gossypioides]
MSFSYYSLPFCKPKEGVKDGAENLGELLMGDRIENSPYRFKMCTNETEIFLCQSNKLSADDFKLLKERNDEMYQVNLILDNLPAIRYTKKEGFMLRWTEYPAGVNIQDAYYVFNHLKFKVLVHKYEETNVARMRGTGDAEVMPAQKEAQAQMTEVLSGWKLVVGDVFRAPSNPALLCIMVGDGVQILGMAVVTILFAALITGMLYFYLILGITAGYVSVRLWRTIDCGDHRGWASVAWKAACFFPGIAFLILTTLNFFSTHLVGGYFGAKAPHIEYPVRTNQIPREIPVQNYPSRLLVPGAGTCMHLCVEDWKWWWKYFFASGSVAIYIFLYSINYLVFDLKSLSGPVFSTLYLGYSLFMVLAIMFATGTVGFLSSFWFVHYLFSSVKLD